MVSFARTALVIGLLRAAMAPARADVVYQEDFQGTLGPEWTASSPLAIGTTPTGLRFLGELGDASVALHLADLPAHHNLSIEFDLFVLKTWDGNSASWGPDVWELEVAGGPTLIRTTFSNMEWEQSYPGEYPSVNLPRTDAVANNSLGYAQDSTYHLLYTLPHTADSIQFLFNTGTYAGARRTQSVTDESWGLDNVEVVLDAPEPGSLVLLLGVWPILWFARKSRAS